MKLGYAPPPEDLADLVSAFYLFEAELDEMVDVERADIGQLRVVLNGSAILRFADGRDVPFLPVSLFGPRLAASHVTAKGPLLKMFGFGILPAGWARIVKRPADDCANHIFSPDILSPFAGAQFYADIATAETFEAMVDVSCKVLRRHFSAPDHRSQWFIGEVDKWLLSGLSPRLADLEDATGLSRRQVERRTKQYYGAPPKFLVRKYRALRAANAMATAQEDWKAFVDKAYYDQSHFIRDIKEFIGMTPGAVRASKSPLSALAFGRSQLAGSVTALVSDT